MDLYNKPVRVISNVTLGIFLLYGFTITVFPLLPFWLDEWLLLDNLKFKTPAELWGRLDNTQQFPRLYLELIKAFSAAFDYSYISLRLPSFLVHTAGVVLLYHLSGRIFKRDYLPRFLWVMIYVSYSTSIHYFVQLKQYTMEMALALVAVWQLLELLDSEIERRTATRTLLLYLGFLLGPFFSYSYPIVIAPIYIIILLRLIGQKTWPTRTWLPLLIGIASVVLCYWVDTRHVLADERMQDFWKDLLMKRFSIERFFTNSYMMFCSIGTGDLFGNVFGVLGVVAFLWSIYKGFKSGISGADNRAVLVQYGVLLVCVALGLFIAGKLPLGTFRLNSFLVPAIGLMTVQFLIWIYGHRQWKLIAGSVAIVLFLALTANVYVTMAELATAEHAKKLSIYRATGDAIVTAQKQKLPIVVTSCIAYPFDDRWPGDDILKTHPRYRVDEPLMVYAVPVGGNAEEYVRNTLPGGQGVIILDGDSIQVPGLAGCK